MEFLVDDRLARAGEHGEPRKGHFGIAARIAANHAALAPGIAGDDGERGRKVDRGEGVADPRVEAADVLLVPPSTVDDARVAVTVGGAQPGAGCAVRLADWT